MKILTLAKVLNLRKGTNNYFLLSNLKSRKDYEH